MNDEKDPTFDSPLPPPKKQESSAPPAFGGGRRGPSKPERSAGRAPASAQPSESGIDRDRRLLKEKEDALAGAKGKGQWISGDWIPEPGAEHEVERLTEEFLEARGKFHARMKEGRSAAEKKEKKEKEPKLEKGGDKEKEIEKKIEDAVQEHAEKRGVEKPKGVAVSDEDISGIAKMFVRTSAAIFGAAGGAVASMLGPVSSFATELGVTLTLDSFMKIVVTNTAAKGLPWLGALINPWFAVGGAAAGYLGARLLTGWRNKRAAQGSPASSGGGSGSTSSSGPSSSPEQPSAQRSDDVETTQDGMMSNLTIKEAALKGVLKPGVQYHAGSFFLQMFGGRESVTVEQMNAYNSDAAVKEKVQKNGRF